METRLPARVKERNEQLDPRARKSAMDELAWMRIRAGAAFDKPYTLHLCVLAVAVRKARTESAEPK
jgi:hypothetical protein